LGQLLEKSSPLVEFNKAMSRTIINFCIDVLLLTITLGLAWTSCLLKVVFPPATRAGGWTLWSLDYDAWSNVQVALLGLILLGILLHLMFIGRGYVA
jgi:uncharacterized protein DUF4405